LIHVSGFPVCGGAGSSCLVIGVPGALWRRDRQGTIATDRVSREHIGLSVGRGDNPLIEASARVLGIRSARGLIADIDIVLVGLRDISGERLGVGFRDALSIKLDAFVHLIVQ